MLKGHRKLLQAPARGCKANRSGIPGWGPFRHSSYGAIRFGHASWSAFKLVRCSPIRSLDARWSTPRLSGNQD